MPCPGASEGAETFWLEAREYSSPAYTKQNLGTPGERTSQPLHRRCCTNLPPTAWRGAPHASVAPVDADCAFLGKIGTVCMSWAAKRETNQEKNQRDG